MGGGKTLWLLEALSMNVQSSAETHEHCPQLSSVIFILLLRTLKLRLETVIERSLPEISPRQEASVSTLNPTPPRSKPTNPYTATMSLTSQQVQVMEKHVTIWYF